MEQLPYALFIVRQINGMTHGDLLASSAKCCAWAQHRHDEFYTIRISPFRQRGQMPLSQPVFPQMELYSSHSRLSISVRRL